MQPIARTIIDNIDEGTGRQCRLALLLPRCRLSSDVEPQDKPLCRLQIRISPLLGSPNRDSDNEHQQQKGKTCNHDAIPVMAATAKRRAVSLSPWSSARQGEAPRAQPAASALLHSFPAVFYHSLHRLMEFAQSFLHSVALRCRFVAASL